MIDSTKLDAGDVSVVEIERTACDVCGEEATHYVMLDMRATGQKSAVAEACEEHAHDFADMLRSSLPDAVDPADALGGRHES